MTKTDEVINESVRKSEENSPFKDILVYGSRQENLAHAKQITSFDSTWCYIKRSFMKIIRNFEIKTYPMICYQMESKNTNNLVFHLTKDLLHAIFNEDEGDSDCENFQEKLKDVISRLKKELKDLKPKNEELEGKIADQKTIISRQRVNYKKLNEEKENMVYHNYQINLKTQYNEDEELRRLKELLWNKKFSDFKIYKRLGISMKKGFYGVNCAVYLCGLEKSNEIFVIKIAFNYGYDNTNAVDINLLKKELVDIPFHTNIASYLHYFIDEVDYSKLPDFNVTVDLEKKTALFVFKYYPRTLENYIHQKKHNLADLDILLKLKQLISGICHLKKHGVCHRDLKPDNVFLEHYNSKCLIGDFGCCLKDSALNFRFTKQMEDGYNKGGALYYLAPEILTCKGGENNFIDYSKNDIFSIGLIGCKMVQKEDVLEENNTKFIGFRGDLKTDKRILEFLVKLMSPNPNLRLDCEQAFVEIEKLLKSNLFL